jgi:ankyrin repeat protein
VAAPYGTTALHLAVESRASLLSMLLPFAVDVDAPDALGGCTALWHAASGGRPEAVRQLVLFGADPNKAGRIGSATLLPLQAAAVHGGVEAVRALLRSGANAELAGWDALHVALARGDEATALSLLARGWLGDRADSAGLTPLHLASVTDAADAVSALAASDVRLAPVDVLRCTPLAYALTVGSGQVVRLLIEAGAGLSAPVVMGYPLPGADPQTPVPQSTAWHLAAAAGDAGTTSAWLEAGGDPDYEDPLGSSLLESAVHGGHLGTVQLLLAAGARTTHQGPLGSTPLHEAASKAPVSVIRALLDAGADKGARDRRGQTAADIARHLGRLDVLELLGEAA